MVESFNPFANMNDPEVKARLAKEKVKTREMFNAVMDDNSIKFMISTIPESKMEGALMLLLYEMFERGWAMGGLDTGLEIFQTLSKHARKP